MYTGKNNAIVNSKATTLSLIALLGLFSIVAGCWVKSFVTERLSFAVWFLIAVSFGFVCFFLLRTRGRTKRVTVYTLIFSLFCTYSMGSYIPFHKSILWVILFLLFFFLFSTSIGYITTKKVSSASIIVALLYALALFIGRQLETSGRFEIMYFNYQGIYSILTLCPTFIVFICQFYMFFSMLVLAFDKLSSVSFIREPAKNTRISKFIYALCFSLFVFICFFPYYKAFYPGILTPDSVNEVSQQLNQQALSNHHPIIHQLLIRLGLFLGKDLESGVAAYSLIQCILMSLAFGCSVSFVLSSGISFSLTIPLLLFYSLYTVNGFYSVTIWKDVIFGGAALILSVLLCKDLENKAALSRPSKIVHCILLIVFSFLFCTFRNNGYYAFLAGFPLFILCNREKWKKYLSVFLITVVLVTGYHHVIYDVCGALKSRTAEALSVPLQQIARVIVRYPQEIGRNEDIAVLEEVLSDIDTFPEIYNPKISDPIKDEHIFNSEKFDADPGRYIKAWASLGIHHPEAYIDALLLQSYGYYYPDIVYWVVDLDMDRAKEIGLGFKEENQAFRQQLADYNALLSESSPLAILYSVGFFAWVLVFSAALLCLKGKGRIASIMFLLLGIWGTSLISPVYCEFRYVYALVTTAPFYLVYAIGTGAENHAPEAAIKTQDEKAPHPA